MTNVSHLLFCASSLGNHRDANHSRIPPADSPVIQLANSSRSHLEPSIQSRIFSPSGTVFFIQDALRLKPCAFWLDTPGIAVYSFLRLARGPPPNSARTKGTLERGESILTVKHKRKWFLRTPRTRGFAPEVDSRVLSTPGILRTGLKIVLKPACLAENARVYMTRANLETQLII